MHPARAQAERLREILGVTDHYFPTRLLDNVPHLRIEVVDDLPASGASFWGQGSWQIHVAATEPWLAHRLTILHELKHIIDHPRQSDVYDERAFVAYGERELIADYFAGCVLVPDALLRKEYRQTPDFQKLAAVFSVSERRIRHRLSEIGLVDSLHSIPRRSYPTGDYVIPAERESERRTV
ncbi:ImmA/IrrE family metallo-endopeptidase [Tessaracoccus palaemonis]|uniref:ImmA/IrrE family metallo-endopeptidase n=1 Tax=Tessaracoccus palaemonis TaxID=2829499 RepID=UPI002103D9B8|nr:ImmA/IrrE family metallo-endopeptidase [Tessaracoccus palaemonis]